jgi:hypothetical protein
MPSPSTDLARRRFLQQSLGAALVAGGGSWALAAPAGDEWACPVLGDLHFDRPEHHDQAWLEKTHAGDKRQIENYCRLTRESLPRLCAAVRRRIETARVPVPAVLQLGDLLEGLCGTPELAERQAAEAVSFVREANLGRPMLMTKGNHDVTGPGAVEAYDRVLLPFMADPTLDAVSSAAFTQSRGGVLLVFYDAYNTKSLDWFEKLLAGRQPQRLVVLIHPPVVPYNARSNWHLYARPAQAPQRQRLLNLLGRHRAVVLCGHLHKYCFLRRRTEQGSFVQLAISSVATDADGERRDERTGLADYSPDLVRLEPNFSPETLEVRRELLSAEKPLIEDFHYADTWGHALLRVSGGEIAADVYRGVSDSPWQTIELS